MSELMRANKVTVKPVDDGFVADFSKTHKHIGTVKSTDTNWKPDDEMTKTGQRESFRAWIIQNAKDFGIAWIPQDMRPDNLKMKPKYGTDEELINDALKMVMEQFKELGEKCKYGLGWGGVDVDEIVPMTKTGKGTDLSKLNIVKGKYKNSGNWAWAVIKLTATYKFKKSEIYLPFTMNLVSGQLSKPKIGIKAFTENIHDEIINAGLATHQELEPPKEKEKKSDTSSEAKESTTEDVSKETKKTTTKKSTTKKSTESKKNTTRSRSSKNTESK